jgi:hypothetical protein
MIVASSVLEFGFSFSGPVDMVTKASRDVKESLEARSAECLQFPFHENLQGGSGLEARKISLKNPSLWLQIGSRLLLTKSLD